MFYKLLGLKVRWRGTQNLPAERHVLVSNHVSVRPTFMLCAVTDCRPHQPPKVPALHASVSHARIDTAPQRVKPLLQVGDLMVLYARPRSYVHLITSRLPKRITQVRRRWAACQACRKPMIRLR